MNLWSGKNEGKNNEIVVIFLIKSSIIIITFLVPQKTKDTAQWNMIPSLFSHFSISPILVMLSLVQELHSISCIPDQEIKEYSYQIKIFLLLQSLCEH